MNISSAALAFMISIVAISSAHAAPKGYSHVPNTYYYQGEVQYDDMPLPRRDPPGPGYVWGCKTNDVGRFPTEKTILGGERTPCNYFLRNPEQVRSAAAPLQRVRKGNEPFTSCSPQELYCELLVGLHPKKWNADHTALVDDLLYKNTGCHNAAVCTWQNMRFETPGQAQARLCPDPKKPNLIRYPSPTQGCISDKHLRDLSSLYGPAYGVSYPGQYVGAGGYGYGYYQRAPYRYEPSSRQGPNVCSSSGDYRRNGGRAVGRC